MKLFLAFILWLSVLLFFLEENVTYTQIFAERIITLTERMSVFNKERLPNKKGFLLYGAP